MREGYAYIAFTDRGERLTEKLAEAMGGEVCRAGREKTLSEWTEQAFPERAGLIFVGAAGIAIRAIASCLRNKTEDPAVIVVDERGRFVIPLLSGHLGGANELADTIAGITGGTAVITTATDLNGVFAVDLWAKRQGMKVLQPNRIKQVSGKILRGEPTGIRCRWPVVGTEPENVRLGTGDDVVVDYRRQETEALQLVPVVLTLGIGCRKGIVSEALEHIFDRFCKERNILPQAIRAAASVSLKAEEEGLLRFCERHDWPIHFFEVEELISAEGDYSASAFVKAAVGVDNVCERAAVLESGGILIERKFARDGVTFALAEQKTSFDWSW